MKNILVVVALIAMAGCMSVTTPIPSGQDTYFISANGHGDFNGNELQAKMMSVANDFCVQEGKRMMLQSTGYGSMYFQCVSERSYAPVNMERAPDVKIESR